jgi:hypothetical protein
MPPPKYSVKQSNYQFKTGHRHHASHVPDVEGSIQHESGRNYNRLPQEIFDLGWEGEDCPTILRPQAVQVSEIAASTSDEHIVKN